MFARYLKITPLLFLGCIIAQSICLTEETMPNDKIIKNHHLVTKMLWSDPTTLDSKIILPLNLDQRKYPIWNSRMYHRLKINPLKIRPLKEDDGGEKLRGQQVSTSDKISRREVPPVNMEVGTDNGDHRERNYVRVAQGEISQEKEIDLSFLDDLGGLASFLPDAENSNIHTHLKEEASSGYNGFFDWFLVHKSVVSISSDILNKLVKTKISRRQYVFVLSTNVDHEI
ncbi:hypothetical protein ACFW04_003225 [Cataglyphis niger]